MHRYFIQYLYQIVSPVNSEHHREKKTRCIQTGTLVDACAHNYSNDCPRFDHFSYSAAIVKRRVRCINTALTTRSNSIKRTKNGGTNRQLTHEPAIRWQTKRKRKKKKNKKRESYANRKTVRNMYSSISTAANAIRSSVASASTRVFLVR